MMEVLMTHLKSAVHLKDLVVSWFFYLLEICTFLKKKEAATGH